MSFILENIGRFSLPNVNRQFSDFSGKNDKLPFCRINFSMSTVEIKEYLSLEPLKELNEFRFYNYEDGIAIADEYACVRVYDNFRNIDMILPPKYSAQKKIMTLLLHAYKYTMVETGNLLIHAAAVEHNGKAIIFCGLPGAGKSTQAHLWEKYMDAKAINLDQPCILLNGDTIEVNGSPWSGKEDCYRNVSFPLSAVIFVNQAPADSLKKLSGGEAFSLLYLNNYIFPLNENANDKYVNVIEKIVSSIPIYRLNCTISAEAVEVVRKTVFGDEK